MMFSVSSANTSVVIFMDVFTHVDICLIMLSDKISNSGKQFAEKMLRNTHIKISRNFCLLGYNKPDIRLQ